MIPKGHFEKGRWIKDEQTENNKCIGAYHVKIEVDRSELDALLEDMKEFEKLLFLKWASKQKHNRVIDRVKRWFE